MRINKEWANQLAVKWIDAFNSHDIEQVFALYTDDFEMSSPYIIERMGVESGILIGKSQVKPYWEKSFAIRPALRFELIDTYIGVDTIIIHYKNVGRKFVCETLQINESGKIIRGCSQHGREV